MRMYQVHLSGVRFSLTSYFAEDEYKKYIDEIDEMYEKVEFYPMYAKNELVSLENIKRSGVAR